MIKKMILQIFFISLLPISANAMADNKGCSESTGVKKINVILEFSNQFVHLGDPIPISIRIVNISQTALSLPAVMRLEDYWIRLEITNADGKTVKYSGSEVKIAGGDKNISIHPGYSWGIEIADISKFYSLNLAGQHKVQAIYGKGPLRDCPNGLHKSNVVDLTIDDR